MSDSSRVGTGPDAAASDEEQIRELLYRYARGVDRRDWDLVRSCYQADATDWHGQYRGGVDGLVAQMRERHARIDSSMHFISNVLIEVCGDTATSEAYCQAYLRSPGAPGRATTRTVRCRYLDRLERRDDAVWRIAERVVTYESITTSVETFEPEPGMQVMRRDADDPLWALLDRGPSGPRPVAPRNG